MPIISINADPLFYANLISTIVCFLIMGVVARIKYSKNYHVTFLLFVGSISWFAAISALAQGALNLQAFWAFIPWQTLGAPYLSLGLMFLFIIQFARSKLNHWRKFVLVAAFVFYAFLVGSIFLDERLWSLPYGRVTPLGFAGIPGPLFSIVAPSGLNIPFALLTILIVVELVDYYRHSKSKLVRNQLMYLAVGVLLYYVAIAGGVFNQLFRILPTASNSLFRTLAAAVILLGLTRHGFYSAEPALEKAIRADAEHEVESGHTYLGLRQEKSLAVFAALVKGGRNGLCVSTTTPEEVRTSYGLEETPVWWLWDSDRKDAISPTDLVGISSAIARFIRRAERPVNVLDGIDLLVAENGFRPTMAMISKLSTLNAEKGGILLISSMASPSAPDERPFLEVLGSASLIEAQVRVPKTVEVGERFQLQIDLFNVGNRVVFLEKLEETIPKQFTVLAPEPQNAKIEGVSLILGGRRLEPLKLESVIVSLRAGESGEVVTSPRIVYKSGEGMESAHELAPVSIKVIPPQELEFESENGHTVFAYLAKAFLNDYMAKRYSIEQSGWRTLVQVSKDTGIPESSLYGREGKFGQVVYELLSRLLIEQRTFKEQRGRGGEIAKYRVPYDRDPIKRYVDRTILRSNK